MSDRNKYGKGECIGEENLVLYVQGKLGPAEQHSIEMHLLNCELCNDALEGLQLMKDKENATVIISSLKRKIGDRLHPVKKIKSIDMQWWQAAAILVIILISAGSYVYISQFSKEGNAVSDYMEPAKEKVMIENPVIQSSDQMTAPEFKNQPSPSVINPPATAVREPSQPAPSEAASGNSEEGLAANPNKVDEAIKEDKKAETEIATKQGKVAEDEQKSIQAKAEEYSTQITNESGVRKRVTEAQQSKDKYANSDSKHSLTDEQLFTAGIEQYLHKNYNDAIAFIEKTTDSEKRNYYLGACYFELKKYNKSISLLNKVVEKGQGPFYEQSMWLKANILVQKNDIVNARNSLQSIVLMNGIYSTRAQQLRDSL